ncbi:mannonate dehydratase [Lentilactobacillus diolivorans]|uniref:mannonate dehydratase n=1 Tax=Lentilactobacillus diolivorans TaxID=179838 RepID=UPI002468B26B|nr:mannonate dehydratase [Lentilactobacillus diolivorans]MDH5105261.1 mannonate dehydratase [Lentilactobacillus diolivorans]
MRNLKMGFRWFGADDDPISLAEIRQIPQTKQVVGALFDVPVGEVWPQDKIDALKKQVTDAGLKLEVIESVNIHDDIKIGLPSRDKYIANYIQTIKNLSKAGIKVICYNFMPVFDWLRTDLHHQLADGSNAMMYDESKLPKDPEALMAEMNSGSRGFSLPGWEPERLAALKELFAAYKDVTADKLRENFKYFLDAIMPTCEKYNVRMAIHPDDPPKPLFGLPRIFKNREDMLKIEQLHESRYNGFTICTGSLGENPKNDLPAIIREFVPKDRVPFMHVRNIKYVGKDAFHESAHPSSEGSLDMYDIMKALHDTDYDGYIRPDHGRNIFGEDGRPGYGLYDRALGITYLEGLWEALEKG